MWTVVAPGLSASHQKLLSLHQRSNQFAMLKSICLLSTSGAHRWDMTDHGCNSFAAKMLQTQQFPA